MRLGIFGGSFDPVHFGHLLLAESCREQCHLDEVWFVPAATPPHKRHRSIAPAKARLEMLRLAVGGHRPFQVSPLELERGGVSYTLETLQAIRAQHPTADLFLLMGADTLLDLPNWREPRRVLELAAPVVVRRAGSPLPDWAGLPALFAETGRNPPLQVEMPGVDFASTDLRTRVREGKSIRFRTPRGVEEYIATHQLYCLPEGDAAPEQE